ncbi:MAG: hypothetical protein JWQ08_972, partial [Deinococcus sp.]|nr:hypothetical protein [Deinococcus sp.]
MDRIAPLAKILAEANGIDWQRLNGTGEGGMIVEQDILNYLSRVMSGEEEPPETPVDLPPPDWEGDLANTNFDMAALSAAGVDSDITSFIEQARPASPQVSATPMAASFEDDAMEFEMDDGEDDGESLLTTEPAATAPAAAQLAEPAMPEPQVPEIVAEVVPQPVVQPEPVFSVPVPEMQPAAVMPEQPAAVIPPAAAAAGKGGLGGLLSRLYQNRAAPQDAPPAPTPVVTPRLDVPVVPEVAAPVVPDIALPALASVEVAAPELTVPELAAPELTAADLSIEAEQNTPDFSAPQVDAPTLGGPIATAPVQPWVNDDVRAPVVAADVSAPAPVAVPATPLPDPVAAAMAGAVATGGASASESPAA